jgi:hypothetical protein
MHKISVKDFPGLNLGDARRNERFVSIIENITAQPGSSIPKQSEDWYETKATYQFFKNKAVSVKALQDVLAAYGAAQVKGMKEVLIVHDTSNISFSDLQCEGLGYLDSKEGRGVMCHSSVAVSTEGLPLSLVHQYNWLRDLENLRQKGKGKKAFEHKESYRWYRGIREVNQGLGTSVRSIHIADREADIYELFFTAWEPNTDLLIRAHYNRKTKGGSPLWDRVGEGQLKGEVVLHLLDEKGRNKKELTALVRYEEVEILRPLSSGAAYESVVLSAITVSEKEPAKGREPLHWKLLTTLEVSSLSDVLRYVRWYTYRWLIERFHYVLKSGTCIEELQLKKAGCLQKAVVLYSLAAFRIMQLVYESRSHPEASCEVVLTNEEWMVLWMLTSHGAPLPAEPPGLAEAVKRIARLGGHLGRKSDGPPRGENYLARIPTHPGCRRHLSTTRKPKFG